MWSGERDSNSRSEFGRLACFQLHHPREFDLGAPGGIRTHNLDVRSVAPIQLSFGSSLLPTPPARACCRVVREDRIELSPRVSRTRMLALHHARECKDEGRRMKESPKSQVHLSRKSQVQCPKSLLLRRLSTFDVGPWTTLGPWTILLHKQPA